MKSHTALPFALSVVLLAGCAGHNDRVVSDTAPAAPPTVDTKFQRDREAILSMAGNYKVTFDFKETVAVAPGYALKDPKLSGGHEVVRVVEDHGEFISLQHLLVAGSGETAFVIKHWRQDWQYQPERMLSFVGGNAWAWEPVPEQASTGAWSQTVYQVEDAPRYAGVAQWDFSNGSALRIVLVFGHGKNAQQEDVGPGSWEAAREWRPLPRRDMTTRSDYHAVDAVNRHVITDWGWVHEQDNAKLSLRGEPQILVHEVGVNTYRRSDDFTFSAADDYWAATAAFWQGVRDHWAAVADQGPEFAIAIKGETEALYGPVLSLANEVMSGEKNTAMAVAEAQAGINDFITRDIGGLELRLRPDDAIAANQ